MKTLLILRHAKSSRDNPDWDDFERPLKKRGKRDAPRMGQLLRDENLVPDLIISSPAERAKRTAIAAAEAAGYVGEIQYEQELYFGELGAWIEILQSVPPGCSSVMLVGHNPGLEILISRLTDHEEPFPTCALAQISLALGSWRDMDRSTSGKLEGLWLPRELAE